MNYLTHPAYSPNVLLNRVMEMIGVEKDAELADRIDIRADEISKVRCKRMSIGDSMLLKLHDLTGLPAKELRRWMGVES